MKIEMKIEMKMIMVFNVPTSFLELLSCSITGIR